MAKPNAKDRQAPQEAKAANAESPSSDNPQLAAALAQFAGILEKAGLPPGKDAGLGPDKAVQ